KSAVTGPEPPTGCLLVEVEVLWRALLEPQPVVVRRVLQKLGGLLERVVLAGLALFAVLGLLAALGLLAVLDLLGLDVVFDGLASEVIGARLGRGRRWRLGGRWGRGRLGGKYLWLLGDERFLGLPGRLVGPALLGV